MGSLLFDSGNVCQRLFAAASCACALFLLFTEKSLLLALCFFKTSHEAALFFGLGGVLSHCFTHLFFAHYFAEHISLNDGDEQRQQVVVAQTGCIIVEEEQEHYRHEIHHPFHSRHGIAAGLVLHSDAGVDDVDYCHQQAE